MKKDILSSPEVAREVGVTPVTVRNWIRTGKLDAIRVGGRLLIRRYDLDAFLCRPAYPTKLVEHQAEYKPA